MKAWLAIALVAASATHARAGHPRVELVLAPCGDAPPEEIRRVVAVELGALLAEPSDPVADHTRAQMSCDGDRVALRVDDPITGKSLTRDVDLAGSLPRARARLVALALVELISSSWSELQVEVAPEIRAASAAAAPSVPALVAPQPLRVELLAGGLAFSNTDVLVGGGVRVARDRSRLGWMIDTQAHHGSRSVSLGAVDVDVLDVGVLAAVHRTWSRTSVHLGAGGRGGLARLAGIPDPMVRASRFWAGWAGATVLGDVELRATDRMFFAASLEGGYVVSGVTGLVEDRREIAIDRVWMQVHVGVGGFL